MSAVRTENDVIYTRARKILGTRPGSATEDVATQILAEIAVEMEVPERLHRAFIELLLPAINRIVASARSGISTPLEEVAARPYLARAVNSGVVGQPDAKPMAISPSTPELTAAPEPVGDQEIRESQRASVPLAPEREEGNHLPCENHSESVASPAPQADGHMSTEAQGSNAILAEREGESGQITLDTRPDHAAPVTPLSLRVEVLDGWRALKDELLYVPGCEGVTYGNATDELIEGNIAYTHRTIKGHFTHVNRMRALQKLLKDYGTKCLNDAFAGREL